METTYKSPMVRWVVETSSESLGNNVTGEKNKEIPLFLFIIYIVILFNICLHFAEETRNLFAIQANANGSPAGTSRSTSEDPDLEEKRRAVGQVRDMVVSD